MALAYRDPDRAGELTRTILAHLDQVARPAAVRPGDDRTGRRWPRPKPPPAIAPAAPNPDFDIARYWAVRALTEVALGVGGLSRRDEPAVG